MSDDLFVPGCHDAIASRLSLFLDFDWHSEGKSGSVNLLDGSRHGRNGHVALITVSRAHVFRSFRSVNGSLEN